MRFAKLFLCAAFVAACGGGDDAADPDPDADAGADAAPDAPVDAAPGAPAITITSHTDGQRITGSRTVTLAGTLVDPDGSTITAVTVALGAAAPVAATFDQTSFSAELQLADDASTITVTATDDSARSSSAQLTLTFPYVTLATFQRASMVLGQTDFTASAGRAADASRVQSPYGKAVEIDGVIYVADYAGDRILGFRGFPALDGAPADFVLGQASFTTSTSGVGPQLLNGPQTVLGHGGRMYTLEYDNSRILIWSTPPTTTNAAADHVIGQGSLTTATAACTAASLRNPEDMIIAGGKLIVSDANNNRVLVWNTAPTTTGVVPDLVLGQADFTHCQNDDDDQNGTADTTTSLRTLDYPTGVWSDGTRLFVVDADNHRVLVWNTFPTTSFQPADVVLGQPDGTTSSSATAADRFSRPYGLASNGNQLFVTERGSNRVKVWNQLPASNVAADVVLGQADFTHGTGNDDDQDATIDAAPTARTLRQPSAVWLVRDRLFVGDTTNNRVLLFGTPVCTLNAGLYEYPAGSGACIDDPCAPSTCTNQRTCARDTGVAVCTCPIGWSGDCDTCRVYVDAAGPSTARGSSWNDAMPSLAAALAAASGTGLACEVWAKEGTYYAHAISDADSFTLASGVSLYGGFAGGEASVAERAGGATILDGRDGAAGTGDVFHVVTAASTSATARLDRVTVRNGNASGSGATADGGGIYVASGARLVVDTCVVEGNRAAGNGGGLVAVGGTGATVQITGSIFRGNVAGTSGGGAHLAAGGSITGSTFEANRVGTAIGHGGGGLTLIGTGTLASTVIRDNTATGDAGGVWFRNGGSTWTITGLQVTGNVGNNGGGVYFDASGATSTMTASVVAGNVARGGGGGLFLRDASPTIDGVTVTGNVAAQHSGGLNLDGTSSTFTNAIVWGNRAPSYADIRPASFAGTFTYGDSAELMSGAGNLAADPRFTHAPATWDRITASPALDTITVTAAASFAVGDYVEIADDGVARQVTAVTGDDLTVQPALAAAVSNVTVQNWASESADLDLDLHLAAGSPCIDAGSPAGTDMGAYP